VALLAERLVVSRTTVDHRVSPTVSRLGLSRGAEAVLLGIVAG
jgi:hypothetical protein